MLVLNSSMLIPASLQRLVTQFGARPRPVHVSLPAGFLNFGATFEAALAFDLDSLVWPRSESIRAVNSGFVTLCLASTF